MLKKILGVYEAPRPHWVGNGFPVRSLFSYGDHGKALSPFLLLDHAGPHQFTPTTEQRGVGTHPHRGFETVTIVYEGEVAHRDSTGAGGTIGPGDVQWMTAASGILHEEFHSEAYARTGGPFEMVQLWVNLPAKDKMAAPGYQTLLNADIPQVALPDGAGSVRVIAGDFEAAHGPASRGPARLPLAVTLGASWGALLDCSGRAASAACGWSALYSSSALSQRAWILAWALPAVALSRRCTISRASGQSRR